MRLIAKYEYWLTTEGLILIEAWARNGLTDEQIASNIGITRSTLFEWKKKHSDISDTLKRGKEIVDIQVENALLKRALGYQYKEVKTEKYKTENGPAQRVTTTIKEVIPDTTAQIFWLKNRRAEVWREKQNVELSGEVKTTNPYEGLTTEELKKLIHNG